MGGRVKQKQMVCEDTLRYLFFFLSLPRTTGTMTLFLSCHLFLSFANLD